MTNSNRTRSDWRALVFASLGALVKVTPAFLLIVLVGSWHAPLFGTADYQLAAKPLLAGEDFYGMVNYDERSFQILMADAWKNKPLEVLVAGSSRTMQLEADCFDGPYFNASVSAAQLSDVGAQIEQFRAGHHLKHVIVAAEPWMLNDTNRTQLWGDMPMPAAAEWVRAELREGIVPDRWTWLAGARAVLEPWREILAPNSFQAAWKIMAEGPPEQKLGRNNLFRKEPDGSLRFPDFFLNVTEAHAAEEAVKAGDGHLASVYRDFTKISPAFSLMFEKLMADVKSSGARVTLVLHPFHPAYYRHVIPLPGGNMIPAVEAYFRGVAKSNGYAVIGAYDPAVTGNAAADFFDGVHMRKAPLKRLFGCREGPKP